jgi:hypothetical protein
MDDETDVDELGPVDWIVVEFPGSKFNGRSLLPSRTSSSAISSAYSTSSS